MPTTDEVTPQASYAELRDEIYRLDAVVSAQQEALVHWRREADRDYGLIFNLRREIQVLTEELNRLRKIAPQRRQQA